MSECWDPPEYHAISYPGAVEGKVLKGGGVQNEVGNRPFILTGARERAQTTCYGRERKPDGRARAPTAGFRPCIRPRPRGYQRARVVQWRVYDGREGRSLYVSGERRAESGERRFGERRAQNEGQNLKIALFLLKIKYKIRRFEYSLYNFAKLLILVI